MHRSDDASQPQQLSRAAKRAADPIVLAPACHGRPLALAPDGLLRVLAAGRDAGAAPFICHTSWLLAADAEAAEAVAASAASAV